MMSSSLDTNNTKPTKPKFWLVVQEQAKKAKLQTEMAWLKRQIGGRQKKLGVELFTILNGGSGSDNNAKQTLLGNDAEAAAAAPLFADSEPSWFHAFEKCQQDLRPLLHQHEALEHECQGLLHRIEEASTPRDKLQLIAKRKQYQAKLLVMEQQIQRRREAFGLSIFDDLSTWTTAISTSDTINEAEQKVIDCIQAALADVRHLQSQINAKYSQVHDLHHGETEGLMAGNHNDSEETTAPTTTTTTTNVEGNLHEDSDDAEMEDL